MPSPPTTSWTNVVLIGGVILPCSLAGMLGCSRPRAVQPTYPSDAGTMAIATYDSNGDGFLGEQELSKVPALRASLTQVDVNGDGQLSAAEIDARIDAWRATKTAEMPVTCKVLLNGAPLASAKIEFTPEPFLGSDVPPAAGTTGDQGTATMSMPAQFLADDRYVGVACGWYQVRITSENHDIPAVYNTETSLGCEVSSGSSWVYEPGMLIFELAK